jgi:hypothetical protein
MFLDQGELESMPEPALLVAHAAGKMCGHLTATQIRYPGINLVLRSEAETHL